MRNLNRLLLCYVGERPTKNKFVIKKFHYFTEDVFIHEAL